MNSKQYCIYILASKKNGTLYTGITSGLVGRIWQHKNEIMEGFTKKYGVHILVHYEIFDDPLNAIKREKRLKKWNREWKKNLIKANNPEWKDLYETIV